MARHIRNLHASPDAVSVMSANARRAACGSFSRAKLVNDLSRFLQARISKMGS
jgi:putative heme iron utilization protein